MAYDRGKGVSISEIGIQIHTSRNTVRKHLRLDKSLKWMKGEWNWSSILK